MPRFDGYTATITPASREASGRTAEKLLGLLWRDGDEEKLARAPRFEVCREVCDPTGQQVGRVAWGRGDHLVMLEASGERTPDVVASVRNAFPVHRCSRVDSCEDFESDGAWNRLLTTALEVKAERGLYGSKAGDWDDFPELGRTLYLGAPSSAVRVRLYEKGKEPDMRHLARPDWVRLEAQVRPQKEGKTAFSQASAESVWGASQFTRDLASRLFERQVEALAAAGGRRLPDRERALRWMCRQYGPHLSGAADDLGGWDVLGLTLREMVDEEVRRSEEFVRFRRAK